MQVEYDNENFPRATVLWSQDEINQVVAVKYDLPSETGHCCKLNEKFFICLLKPGEALSYSAIKFNSQEGIFPYASFKKALDMATGRVYLETTKSEPQNEVR